MNSAERKPGKKNDDEYFENDPNAARFRDLAHSLLSEPGATKEDVRLTLKGYGVDDDVLDRIFHVKEDAEQPQKQQLQQQAQGNPAGEEGNQARENEIREAALRLAEIREKGNKGTQFLRDLKKQHYTPEEIARIDQAAGEPAENSRKRKQDSKDLGAAQKIEHPAEDATPADISHLQELMERIIDTDALFTALKEEGWQDEKIFKTISALKNSVASDHAPSEVVAATDTASSVQKEAAPKSVQSGTREAAARGEIDRTRLRKAAQQIVRQWEQGVPNDKIEEDLTASGWKAEDISEVFTVADMTHRRWSYDEAASLNPAYEAPIMDRIKRAYDPLHRFFEKLSKEEQNKFQAHRAYLTYGVSRESGKGDSHDDTRKEDIVWQRVDNYHDFLRLCQGPLRGLHTRISVSGRNFLDRLADPKDPLHVYEEEWNALRDTIRRSKRGEFPRDEYARAVLRGEVKIPEVTDEDAWAPLVPASFAEDETIIEEWVPEVPELVSEEDVSSAEILDSELLNATEPDDGFELPVEVLSEPKIDPIAARIEVEEQDAIDRRIAMAHPDSGIEEGLKSFDDEFNRLYPIEPGRIFSSAPDDVFDAFHQLKHRYRDAAGDADREAVAAEMQALLNAPRAADAGTPSVSAPRLNAEEERQRIVDEELAKFKDYGEGYTPLEDATRREWQDKLKGLIEGVKDKLNVGERANKMKGYLAGRANELGGKAKEMGPATEKLVRALGTTYDKMGWKSKLAVGAGLGIGAAAFSGVSTPIALVFGAGLGIQRVAGMSSMFLKIEKYLQDNKGKISGMGSVRIQNEKIKGAAAFGAVAYTALMGAAIGEGVHLASESSYGQAVHEWLGKQMGLSKMPAASTSSAETAPAPSPTPDRAPAPSPSASASSPEAAAVAQSQTSAQPAAAAAAAAEVTPEISKIEVKATPGKGYEYMTKRLWEQLQEKNIELPQGANPNSDLAKLLAADKESIDAVVHQLAQKNEFFKEGGASVRINLDSHMSIDAKGNIVLDGANIAPQEAPTTPASRPEGSGAHANAGTPIDRPNAPGETPEAEPSAVAGTHATEVTAEQYPSNESPLIETQGPAPVIEKSFVVNAFDLTVPLAEPHLYAGPTGENAVYAFGGDKKARLEAIFDYLSAHPTDTVIAADETEKYRAVWSMKDGKMTSSEPLQKTGFFARLSGALMSPPEPGELTKLIK